MSDQEINILLERAKRIQMSPAQTEEQRRSFAYGNANIENADVTKEIIDQMAEEIANKQNDSAG